MATLFIGRQKFAVDSASAAVNLHDKLRDESDAGASTWPKCKIVDGKKSYRVSYNGRVWGKGADGVEVALDPSKI